jgi:hypothetical protein
MISVLITALGFVVGLALSIRSTTAYERFIEGRKSIPPFLHFHEELMGVGIGRRSCLRFVIWRALFGFMWQNVRAIKAKKIFLGNCTPLPNCHPS